MPLPERSAAQPQRIYVVAGMHRAGTSVMARALQALGIDLGPCLMSADVRMNARGFFEDLDLVGIDDDLLAACAADWKSVAVLDEVDWDAPAFSAPAALARAFMAARVSPTGAFGCKDPRIPRLLPFWQRQFATMGLSDHYIVAIRHPRSVVDSLTARDGLDPRRSAWLWLIHLACALYYAAGRPLVVVDYDQMLAAPRRELTRIRSALSIPLVAALDVDAALSLFVDDFLTSGLRHAKHAGTEFADAPFHALVSEAWALASALARDELTPAVARAPIAALFARIREMSPLLAYAGAVERVADDVPRLEGELQWARASLSAAVEHASSLAAVLDERDRAQAAAAEFAIDLSSTLQRKDAELAEVHRLLEHLQQRVLGRALLRAAAKKA